MFAMDMAKNGARTLVREVYEGPENPAGTWLVENDANAGLFGTLAGVSAERAYAEPATGRGSIAQHAHHLLFTCRHVNAFSSGQEPEGDWESSWKVTPGSDETWAKLQTDLRSEYEKVVASLSSMPIVESNDFAACFGFIAHSAYHLGAIRQLAIAP